MILPIVVFGDPVLRKPATEITPDYPGLETLIADMYETMYNAQGVGLAAPQIGKSIRLFITDGAAMQDNEHNTEPVLDMQGFKQVFINPTLISESGVKWSFNEGCLSIPGVREDVSRHQAVHLRYYDAQFIQHEQTFYGLQARIIQHEYDHLEGILFTDKIAVFRKPLIRNKLSRIMKGESRASYPTISAKIQTTGR